MFLKIQIINGNHYALRSSYDPNPYPENFVHNIDFSIGVINNSLNNELIKLSTQYIKFNPANLSFSSIKVNYNTIELTSKPYAINSLYIQFN